MRIDILSVVPDLLRSKTDKSVAAARTPGSGVTQPHFKFVGEFHKIANLSGCIVTLLAKPEPQAATISTYASFDSLRQCSVSCLHQCLECTETTPF